MILNIVSLRLKNVINLKTEDDNGEIDKDSYLVDSL